MSKIAASKFLIADDGVPTLVEFEPFLQWARKKIGQNGQTSKAMEHMANWIGDDLHVRRLRRLWTEISDSIGDLGKMLPDDIATTQKAPPEPPQP